MHRHGVAAHVLSLMPELPPIRSKAISSFRYAPSEPEAFAEYVIELIPQNSIEYIYPCGDEALSLLVQCEKLLRPLVKIGCPDGEIVNRVLDKSITLAAATKINLPIPKEYQFNTVNDFRMQSGSIIFPVIAKPRSKDSQGAAFRIRRYESVAKLAEEFNQDADFGLNVVVQEFLPGVGVGIEVLMQAGEPLVTFQHRRVTELPIAGGVSVRARSEPVDHHLEDYAIRLLKAIEWNGVAMVEFRHDPATNRLALMEINGRYWGSLPLSFFAGYEFPWYEWQLAHGETPSVPPTYNMVEMRWLSGELQRIPQIIGEALKGRANPLKPVSAIVDLLTGFVTPIKDALWAYNDRAPAWDELKTVWRTVYWQQALEVLGKLLPPLKKRNLALRRYGSARAARLYDDLKAGKVRPVSPPGKIHVKRMLVLCHGNIMRSPFVHNFLTSLPGLAGVQIESGGLAGIAGRPATSEAIRMAREFGVNLNQHRAQPAHSEAIERADAIIVMDYRNLAMLLARWPEVKSKVFMLADFLGQNPDGQEIPDPYGENEDALRHCYVQLMAACRKLKDHISQA